MDYYRVVVAEKSGIRHVFIGGGQDILPGDIVCGKNASITLRGYKVVAWPEIIVPQTGADAVLQAMYKGDIPEITRVTREVWTKEAASDVQDG